MGDRARAKWAKKVGGCCAPFRGGAGSHLTQCRLGQGLPPYQVVSWSIQPFDHNRHRPQFADLHASVHKPQKRGGGCCAPFCGEAGFLSDTMWPRLRPTAVPSGILIHLHPTVWPQYTNVTDRQTGQWSSDEDLVMRSKCQKRYKWLWLMNF